MKKYRPSNGTEGECFMDIWCFECERDRAYQETCESKRPKDGCIIISKAQMYDLSDPEYPEEWIVDDSGYECPACTAFQERLTKEGQAAIKEIEYRREAEKKGQLRICK